MTVFFLLYLWSNLNCGTRRDFQLNWNLSSDQRSQGWISGDKEKLRSCYSVYEIVTRVTTSPKTQKFKWKLKLNPEWNIVWLFDYYGSTCSFSYIKFRNSKSNFFLYIHISGHPIFSFFTRLRVKLHKYQENSQNHKRVKPNMIFILLNPFTQYVNFYRTEAFQ